MLVRHADAAAASDDSATLDWRTPDGRYLVPMRVTGRDAEVLVAGYDLGGQRLVWSNSEIMTHAFIGGRDVAVLYGTAGSAGSTVLRYPTKPSVSILDGSVRASYALGDLRLDYTHSGLSRVLVSNGGRRPLLLLIGAPEEAARFWVAGTDSGRVLVRGSSLVRSAAVTGSVVSLRADLARAEDVEVFADARVLLVNGTPVPTHATPSGSLLASLPGPEPVTLPALTGWRSHTEAPEARPGFDDAGWTAADATGSESPLKPKTPTVLYADDYGFHYGDVWYGGHFTATGAESAVSLNVFTGRRGSYLVWLNGRYLGSAAGGVQADSDAPANPDPGRGDFPIPPGTVEPGQPAVLSVLVENMGHNNDWIADDNRFKQPRGIYGASIAGSDAPISWRIQGTRGGEDLVDRVRGPLNNGGLFGERAGWHLPDYPDRSWPAGAVRQVSPGITWERTTFRLDLPKGQDVPVVLRFAVLTAKHHDGFCLGPSRYTSYSVASSSVRRDVVREYVDAFRARGVTPCLYFSIWDRTNGVGPN